MDRHKMSAGVGERREKESEENGKGAAIGQHLVAHFMSCAAFVVDAH